MKLEELAGKCGEWLRGSGPDSDIVVSTRIRLARNLAEFPFIRRCTGLDRAAIEQALVGGAVQRVIHMKTLHLGPDELLVAAKIAVEPTDSAQSVAQAIDDAEARVRAGIPLVLVMYLEPDIDREP